MKNNIIPFIIIVFLLSCQVYMCSSYSWPCNDYYGNLRICYGGHIRPNSNYVTRRVIIPGISLKPAVHPVRNIHKNIRRVLKVKNNSPQQNDPVHNSYQSIESLKNWYNNWKQKLSLTPEQIIDLKHRLDNLEKIYNSQIYDTRSDCNKFSKKSTRIKCQRNIKKAIKLSKRITSKSNELSDDEHESGLYRQDLSPLTTAISGGEFAAAFPDGVAHLAIVITTLALNIANRVGYTQLAQIRQEQLNSLGALAGAPIGLVNPAEDPALN